MAVTAEFMKDWCTKLLDPSSHALLTLEQYLASIPRLGSLGDLPSGTTVLIRGDVDAKPGPNVGDGDVRLRSMMHTLQYGRRQGWKMVVFGHIGRKPEGTLKAVADRLGRLLETDVPLVSDWWNEDTSSVTQEAKDAIAEAAPGSVLVLENTRKYEIERALWKASVDDLDALAPRLARFASELVENVATVFVNEALSAGSMDSSSTVAPAGMQRVALGEYVAAEFDGPMLRCRDSQLVIFSGLKADKLDDLEAMIGRGKITTVFAAGSLAMALRKGAAELDGEQFCMGLAEDETQAAMPFFVSRDRIEQAKKMVADGRSKGIEFVLPIDFVLQDGQVSETIGPADQQLDIGPQTSELFEAKVGEFLAKAEASGEKVAAFHNGVFGKFEDPQFEGGTQRFISQLKRMKDAGVDVYVGGGEGGAALDRYGQPDWVTHCFTAGGTVLNALSGEPIPYLVALHAAAT